MKLSIVATLYQSAAYVQPFYQRAQETAIRFADNSYEIILVNDGSPDNSLDLAIQIHKGDPHVVVLDLSRNFGHHRAMMTGLHHASGEYVFLIDSDLEEEPEWLIPFWQRMKDDHCDVVYGIQRKRKGGLFERVSGRIYYTLFRMLTSIDQPNNIVTARLMTHRYVQALLSHHECEINIGGLWMITGFKQSQEFVVKYSTSPTTYSFSMKLGHFVNAVTSFSAQPLVFIFYTGLFISLSAMLHIGYLSLRYLFVSSMPTFYMLLASFIWLFSGLIIFFLGIQGIYIAKIFLAVSYTHLTLPTKRIV